MVLALSCLWLDGRNGKENGNPVGLYKNKGFGFKRHGKENGHYYKG